jgi:hypothetical protein
MTPPALDLKASTDQRDVDALLSLPETGWDKKISADLIGEMEFYLADKVTTIPQMRQILAVKGYECLLRRIEIDVEGKSGPDAVRAMAAAMRNFALERPGLSSATFRTPASDSPAWRRAGAEVFAAALHVFKQVGLEGQPAEQAVGILRSLVRGSVISEISASFFIEPSEYQRTYDLAVEVFILGLPALLGPTAP